MLEKQPFPFEFQLIYLRLKDETNFPAGYCWEASIRVESWGYRRVRGYFRLDTPIAEDGALFEPHGWNLDDQGRIIDMTASQFNDGLNHESQIPEGVLIIEEDDPLYNRYRLKKE
ncbi:MAG: hypothetical protein M1511_13070 [Deltaproteobacteria bacterium]|nr:hypothetical protein [Deltaproteobacteria bacterium]